jgi:cytidylate kinase
LVQPDRKRLIITIDGPAGSGKSTTASRVAQALNYLHLDSGAMYRAVTLAALDAKVDLEDDDQIIQIAEKSTVELMPQGVFLRVFLNRRDVTDAIRSPKVTEAIAPVAANPKVREMLAKVQRHFAVDGGIVADGRDMGTVVFPNADLKIFLVASIEERARRRQSELSAKGIEVSLDDLRANILKRDVSDSSRKISPLLKPEDAVTLDTSEMSIDQQVTFVVNEACKRGAVRQT